MGDMWGSLAAMVAVVGAVLAAIAFIWRLSVKLRDALSDIDYLKTKVRNMAANIETLNDKIIPLRDRVKRNESDIQTLTEKIDDGFASIATESKGVQKSLGELTGVINAMNQHAK